MKTVEYYFDFLSPFSYLSWQHSTVITRNPNLELILKPVMMTTLFQNHGIKAPGEVAPKREFMLKQVFRYCHKNNIPLCPPAIHPFNPLYVLRLATKAASREKQFQVIDAIWDIGWAKGLDIGNPDLLETELSTRGLNGKQLLENSFTREAKTELKNNIQEAKDRSLFGVPSWVYQGELFWGNDAWEDLFNCLQGQDQWDRDTYNKSLANNPLPMASQL